MRHAVRVVAAGEASLSPTVTRRVIGEFAGRPAASDHDRRRLGALTESEREVAALVALGLSNDEIGARLNMSPLTAKTYVSRAIGKLGVRDRAQLVVVSHQTGLVRAQQ